MTVEIFIQYKEDGTIRGIGYKGDVFGPINNEGYSVVTEICRALKCPQLVPVKQEPKVININIASLGIQPNHNGGFPTKEDISEAILKIINDSDSLK